MKSLLAGFGVIAAVAVGAFFTVRATVAHAPKPEVLAAKAAFAHEQTLEAQNPGSPYHAVSVTCLTTNAVKVYDCRFIGLDGSDKHPKCYETYVHYNPTFAHPIAFWPYVEKCGQFAGTRTKATPYPGEPDYHGSNPAGNGPPS